MFVAPTFTVYDWRRNKSGITIYAYIWHLYIALIILRYFIDFASVTDWYFIRALWKMNIKIILSVHCHALVIVIHCTLTALFLLSINLSISLKIYFYISSNCIFYRQKKRICKQRFLYLKKKFASPSKTPIPEFGAIARRCTPVRRARGELLEIRFARYTTEQCSVINFMSSLPIVECSYLTTRCARPLWYKRSWIWRVSATRILFPFLAYTMILEKWIITRRTSARNLLTNDCV